MGDFLQQAPDQLQQIPEWLTAIKDMIQDRLGTPGLIAAIILVLTVAVQLTRKLVILALNILRYVILPSMVVTFLAVLLFSASITIVLPASVSFFSLVLLYKG
ncbi:MAG: hypothetical protein JSV44_06030 [Candidatus Zixiibacteriota bacterium]|nr:MAG: hypothetical protein JSV44_06030 [candidate division Zixibacteria bacterium]